MKIKICGLFHDCDINYVNEIRPDYIGFVFAKSKRQVTIDQALKFKEKLNDSIAAVGVFVDEDIKVINSIIEKGIIDIAQLHGYEDESYINQINVPVIKAIRIGEKVPINTDYVLFDNNIPGSGKVFDWSLLPQTKKPFFIAGGININNIEDVIKLTPFGIDVSSGVETKGFKDREKIQQIVRRIRNV